MTISEVSRKYGISPDTLRYYERVGVLPAVHRTKSGVRDYTDEDCGWVDLACCMRRAGLPLEELAEYVRLTQQGDETIPVRRELLCAQRSRLEAQMNDIRETMAHLDYKISRYDAAIQSGTLTWE